MEAEIVAVAAAEVMEVDQVAIEVEAEVAAAVAVDTRDYARPVRNRSVRNQPSSRVFWPNIS